MKFRKINSDYAIRLEKGEEVIKELTELCKRENIKGAYFTGIGAASKVALGWFNPVTKVYARKEMMEYFEITSLVGNVGVLADGDPIIHTHINLSDKNYTSTSGHVFECVISLAGEIFLRSLEEDLNKSSNNEFGLNFLEL